MKKILILIHDMEIGGAQKSLLSFLQCLAASPEGKTYSIHLMPINPTGAFLSQIPEGIRLVQPPKELRWLGTRFSFRLLREYFSWRAVWGEVSWLVRKKLKRFPAEWNLQQCLWTCWKDCIPELTEHYDVAISYMDGVPNYYVMDKVHADKKVLWVHSEYQKLEYNVLFDAPFFEQCDRIITISDNCRSCLLQDFPQYGEKLHVLENISSGEQVIEKSRALLSTEFDASEDWKLLSVGRLNYQKGFDLAITAAKILRERGLHFLWLIVGEGTERQSLQEMIDDYGLIDCVRLVGARENPYVYMRACDILIQPSRMEGKSIVLDEAKILCKPIVSTNYTTVWASVAHGESGWIVDMAPDAIAEGILMLCRDEQLRTRLQTYLQERPKGNETEFKKYIDIMF